MNNLTTEELIDILHSIRLPLSRTEHDVITEVINRLENPPDIELAKKIRTMISYNATVENIDNFISSYIQSKEEENG